MTTEYLIYEKLKSNLVIEKCNDKNIRIYICQIIGSDTDGYGGYSVNEDMVNFIEANFDVKFSDESGFQPGFLLPWLMYDCPLSSIINILTEFNLYSEYLFYFKDEKYYWGSFFLPEESGFKTFFSGIDSISQSNNLIFMTNGFRRVLFDLEYDKSGMLLNNLFADLDENHDVYLADFYLEEVTLCQNNRILMCFEVPLGDDQGDFCVISFEYVNHKISNFEEHRTNNLDKLKEKGLIPIDNLFAQKVEKLLLSTL
jgi:hypothetical protein